jgi:hypothetical protein
LQPFGKGLGIGFVGGPQTAFGVVGLVPLHGVERRPGVLGLKDGIGLGQLSVMPWGGRGKKMSMPTMMSRKPSQMAHQSSFFHNWDHSQRC